MKKATHRGECQVCGRLQRLPSGVLSKHGYTVEWSFFQGVCWGAGYQPLELDKSLVVQAIERARAELEAVRAYAAEVRAATGLQGWLHHWERDRHGSQGRYVWREVEFYYGEPRPYAELGLTMLKGEHVPEEHASRYSFHLARTPKEYAAQSREKRAQALDRDAEEIERYIAWQTNRLQIWQARPLQLIEEG